MVLVLVQLLASGVARDPLAFTLRVCPQAPQVAHHAMVTQTEPPLSSSTDPDCLDQSGGYDEASRRLRLPMPVGVAWWRLTAADGTWGVSRGGKPASWGLGRRVGTLLMGPPTPLVVPLRSGP
jgi:hypothetical protein